MHSRGRLQVLSLSQGTLDSNVVCRSCLRTIRKRHASTAAAVAEAAPSIPEASQPKVAYRVQAGVVLSRPPIVTRDLHPFEKAFFLYQKRLNERLALPFTRYLYFKKNTPAILDFKQKVKERKTPARDIGVYDAYGSEKWNDEVLIGALEGEREHQMEALLKDAEPPKDPNAVETESNQAKAKGIAQERPSSRVTEADQKGDEKSLNRQLQRTLYLLVEDGQKEWKFPTAALSGKETLRQAAERILTQTGGDNMNTWLLGNLPVGHSVNEFAENTKTNEQGVLARGEKTFFLRGRIMAGQASLVGNELGAKDFKWLSREEIQKLVTPSYWSHIKNMLPER